MTAVEVMDPREYLAYQNGRAAFLLKELLTGEQSRFVQSDARAWLAAHEAWLATPVDRLSDPCDAGGIDDEEEEDGEFFDDEDDIDHVSGANRILYAEGWL